MTGGTLVMLDPTALKRRFWESQKVESNLDPDHWNDFMIELRRGEVGREFSDTVRGVIDANRFEEYKVMREELGKRLRGFTRAHAEGIPTEQIPDFDPWINLRMDLVEELRGITLASEALRLAKESANLPYTWCCRNSTLKCNTASFQDFHRGGVL